MPAIVDVNRQRAFAKAVFASSVVTCAIDVNKTEKFDQYWLWFRVLKLRIMEWLTVRQLEHISLYCRGQYMTTDTGSRAWQNKSKSKSRFHAWHIFIKQWEEQEEQTEYLTSRFPPTKCQIGIYCRWGFETTPPTVPGTRWGIAAVLDNSPWHNRKNLWSAIE